MRTPAQGEMVTGMYKLMAQKQARALALAEEVDQQVFEQGEQIRRAAAMNKEKIGEAHSDISESLWSLMKGETGLKVRKMTLFFVLLTAILIAVVQKHKKTW